MRLEDGGEPLAASFPCMYVVFSACFTPSSKLPERPWKLPDLSPEPVPKRTRRDLSLPAIGGVGAASPFVVYEPVEVVSAVGVEGEPGCSPGESKMI